VRLYTSWRAGSSRVGLSFGWPVAALYCVVCLLVLIVACVAEVALAAFRLVRRLAA
jgi:hypothetical protein